MIEAGMALNVKEWAGLRLNRPLVMGILNVTPDSFSDGGQHFAPEAAIAAGQRMLAEGADILDIGGESTRPNATPMSAATEIERITPVIRPLAAEGAVISIDTRNAETMAAGLAAGGRIVNDISGLRHDPAALPLLARLACPVVLMHMRGTPETMSSLATYKNVAAEVAAELTALRDAALAAGVRPEHICLDPGIGFAKRGAQNIALLQGLQPLAALGHPLLIGLSRKHFLGEISGETIALQRGPESLAGAIYACTQGAHILRVHDVAGTVKALRVWQKLTERDDG
ncbi:MAG: dihydropteroate synthase [Rhodospirillales bacterium]|nr:dihydropteroate synthase [Rhodospirillales bacterium]